MNEPRAVFSTHFIEDLEYWVRTDRKTALRLLRIIQSSVRDPLGGIAKPGPLRGQLSGLWSRRLTQEHRIVYEPSGDVVRFLQARYHY